MIAFVCSTSDGGDLILKAPAPPPAGVIDLLTRHKRQILALLRAGTDWSAEDGQSAFDAYANRYVFDTKGVSDGAAHAFDCCLTLWLNRNPTNSPSTPTAASCRTSGNRHDDMIEALRAEREADQNKGK
jgi:hypothetical protein